MQSVPFYAQARAPLKDTSDSLEEFAYFSPEVVSTRLHPQDLFDATPQRNGLWNTLSDIQQVEEPAKSVKRNKRAAETAPSRARHWVGTS